MEQHTVAQARALELTLGRAASPASRRAVVQLARLPPALKENLLVCYVEWDLGNLVRCAIAAGAPANTRFGDNDTPVLCYAAQEGSARSLKALLTGGADVRLTNKDGTTALLWAAQKGHTPCVSLLLEAGAPLEAKGSGGRTALAVAASKGHSEAVTLLLERGADAYAVDTGTGNTPLVAAICGQHTRCVELLLPHSDLSIANKQGLNAFHVCVMTASYDCFKLLLPRMTDVDVRTVPDMDEPTMPFNETAAHLACIKGQHKMLEKLLRRRRLAEGARQRAVHASASRCCGWPAELYCPADWPSRGLQDGAGGHQRGQCGWVDAAPLRCSSWPR